MVISGASCIGLYSIQVQDERSAHTDNKDLRSDHHPSLDAEDEDGIHYMGDDFSDSEAKRTRAEMFNDVYRFVSYVP